MVLLFPDGYQPAKKMESPTDISIADIVTRSGSETASDLSADVKRALPANTKSRNFIGPLPRFAEADGDGHVLFVGLTIGRYRVIVISKHTLAGPNLRFVAKQILRDYFTDSFANLGSQLKLDIADIDILPGETTEKSFHFE